MKLLLVAATTQEISPTVRWLKDSKQQHSCDCLITGPGIFNTAFFLSKYLTENKHLTESNGAFSLVINAGICGSFNADYPPGSTVSIIEDCLADFGAEDGAEFLHASALGLTNSDQIDWIKSNPSSVKHILENSSGFKPVRGITVNTVSGREETIEMRKKKFNAQTESMEGAAVFMACQHYNLPVIQLRAVSNRVERRNKKNWNIPVAVETLNRGLSLLLEQILYGTK